MGHPASRCREAKKKANLGIACREVSSLFTTAVKDSCNQEELGGDSSVEVVSTLAGMPVTQGTCGKPVQVLRDTGCSTVVVRRELVPKECFTGEDSLANLINGEVYSYPLAEVEINSPFYSGRVPAVCMENPVYKVIVGNLDGATA